jgi:hypothetical protein
MKSTTNSAVPLLFFFFDIIIAACLIWNYAALLLTTMLSSHQSHMFDGAEVYNQNMNRWDVSEGKDFVSVSRHHVSI